MKRRNFLVSLPLAGIFPVIAAGMRPSPAILAGNFQQPGEGMSRDYWLSVLERIAKPVLTNLAAGTLRENMPVEAREGHDTSRRLVSHLEAFGRLMAGIAPWLACTGMAGEAEQNLRKTILKDYYKAMTMP